MLNWLAQVATLTAFNLRTVRDRAGSSASAAVGIAFVVAVLVGVLSIGQGLRHTMVAAGSPDTAIALRSGADSELTSVIGREEARLLEEMPGVARGEAGPLVSPELFVVINLPKRTTGTDANVPMRGVEPAAFEVHRAVQLVAGRPFERGTNEVIVGRAATEQFVGLEVGSELVLGANRWRVVGMFEAAGGLPESEIWADAAVLQPAYQRGTTYQSAKVRLASAGRFQELADAVSTDPRLNLKLVREQEYYASQSRTMENMITGLGFIIALLMGIAAILGALNTMYTAVAARSREIATLRALGFGRSPVVLSVLAESLVLAAAGGTIGALVAWAAFDGYRTATLNWQSFSQVAFAFQVGPALLAQGVAWALVLGFFGGLLPALRAARTPVAVALREP